MMLMMRQDEARKGKAEGKVVEGTDRARGVDELLQEVAGLALQVPHVKEGPPAGIPVLR